jgi:hypothetical protein
MDIIISFNIRNLQQRAMIFHSAFSNIMLPQKRLAIPGCKGFSIQKDFLDNCHQFDDNGGAISY